MAQDVSGVPKIDVWPEPTVVTSDLGMYGTISWHGTVNRMPAILCSHKDGATLWVCRPRWFRQPVWSVAGAYDSTASAEASMGL